MEMSDCSLTKMLDCNQHGRVSRRGLVELLIGSDHPSRRSLIVRKLLFDSGSEPHGLRGDALAGPGSGVFYLDVCRNRTTAITGRVFREGELFPALRGRL